MNDTVDLQIVPGETQVGVPVFKDHRENEKYNREFLKLVEEWLRVTAKAREQSQEQAMRRWRR